MSLGGGGVMKGGEGSGKEGGEEVVRGRDGENREW